MKNWFEVARATARVIRSRNVDRRKAMPPLDWQDVLLMLAQSLTGSNRLWLSRQYMDAAGPAEGLRFAHKHVPAAQRPGISLLQANAAGADDAQWLTHINEYLSCFETSPIALSPGNTPRFERLRAAQQHSVEGGDLISVIMPAYNSAGFIRHAIDSILSQTWKNLELIVVDDCSQDDTWSAIQTAAAADKRVRPLRNEVNVGPYVSKNLALRVARGKYITGHDADDWSHPERLQRDMETLKASDGKIKAVVSMMVRTNEQGQFYLNPKPKGSMRLPAPISLLIETAWLRDRLGAWDSVRFGADNELIGRAEKLLGPGLHRSARVNMLCLESAFSLSGHPVHGVMGFRNVSPVRQQFKNAYAQWHAALDPANASLSFPPGKRPYEVPEIMAVSLEAILRNIAAHDRQSTSLSH